MKSVSIKIIGVFLLLQVALSASAQLKLKEHVWPTETNSTELPDSLKNYDAIIVFQRQDIKNFLDISSGVSYNSHTIRTRIKINTQKGLDDLSTISIYKSKYRSISVLDARTIKKDGSYVDLKTSDIKILDIKTDKNRINFDVLRFSIPGVQVGDELEYIYVLESRSLLTSADIFMHNELPIMKAEFEYSTDNALYTEFRMYNDMPDPKITRSVNDASFKWTLTNLPGLGTEKRYNLTESLPYIRFALRKIVVNGLMVQGLTRMGVTENNWAEIYDVITASYKNVNYEDYYKGTNAYGYLKKLKPMLDTMSVDEKMNYLISFINDSLEIVRSSEMSDMLPLSNYIYNRKIEESNVHVLLRYYMDFFNIKFYLGFGRDRIDGSLDLQFATSSMITDILYMYENENGDVHFIFPSNPFNKYQVDELPHRITGTNVVIVHRPSVNSLKSTINLVKIPMNPYNANTRTRMSSVQMNFKTGECIAKSKETLMGDFSTTLKNIVYDAQKERNSNDFFKSNYGIPYNYNVDTFAIDHYKKSYPYNFNFNYQGAIKIDVREVEKGVYSIPLNGLLDHFKFPTEESDITLNYYCPFLYQDNQKVYLQFEKAVEILNNDLGKLWISDEVGNYLISFTKINDKTILIDSKLDVRKDKLSPEEYKILHKLNGSAKNANESRLLVKTI